MERDRADANNVQMGLPKSRRQGQLPALSRGARKLSKKHQRAKTNPLFHDLWTELPNSHEMPRKRRHATHRRGRAQRRQDRADTVSKDLAA